MLYDAPPGCELLCGSNSNEGDMAGLSVVRLLGAGAFALAVTCVAWGPGVAAPADERARLLIVGQDGDPNATPRSTSNLNRALAALTNEVRKRGFTVYDEGSVGIDITKPGRVYRTDAELISIAQRVPQPPVDAVVAVNIFMNAQPSRVTDLMRPHVRFAWRVIQVQTGKLLNNYELAEDDLPILPGGCVRDCALDELGKAAQLIARDAANVLAGQLDEQFPAGAKAGSR
jgi:hypothetical protein